MVGALKTLALLKLQVCQARALSVSYKVKSKLEISVKRTKPQKDTREPHKIPWYLATCLCFYMYIKIYYLCYVWTCLTFSEVGLQYLCTLIFILVSFSECLCTQILDTFSVISFCDSRYINWLKSIIGKFCLVFKQMKVAQVQHSSSQQQDQSQQQAVLILVLFLLHTQIYICICLEE